MPSIGKFSVWIEVDRERLREYAVSYESKTKVKTCWVSSETGKKFKIYGQDEARRRFTTAYVATLDGQLLPSCRTIEPQHNSDLPVCFSGIDSSRGKRPFVFSPCTYVELEEDTLNVTTRIDTNIGNIKVVVRKSKVLKEELPAHVEPETTGTGCGSGSTFPELLLNERGKKGIVHGIQLGDIPQKDSISAPSATSAKNPPRYSQRVEYGEVLATFIFKYRPFDVLLAQGYVRRLRLRRQPQPPSPSIGQADSMSAPPPTPQTNIQCSTADTNTPQLWDPKDDPDLKPMRNEEARLQQMSNEADRRLFRLQEALSLRKP